MKKIKLRKKFITIMGLFILSLPTYAIRNGESTHLPSSVVTLDIHGGEFTCAGLRISQKYIVTATHCITSKLIGGGSKKGKIKIKYSDHGEKEIHNTRVKRGIIKSYTHSEELTVFKIASNNVDFKAPKISLESSDIYLNNYLFYGQGTDDQYRKDPLKGYKLRKGYLEPKATISEDGHTLLVMKPGEFDQQPCPGDSGGPLFTPTGLAIGILSKVASSKHKLPEFNGDKIKQCKLADRSYFIYLAEHLDFLRPYLDETNKHD
jgi:V8-like Glu-specific endopeptidase